MMANKAGFWAIMGALCAFYLSIGAANAGPSRILSLDYCADQYVLGLVSDQSRIAGLTRFAQLKEQSSHWQKAQTIPIISRNDLETILSFAPDLVIDQPYAPKARGAALKALGIDYYALPAIHDFETALQVTASLGALLGESQKAKDYSQAARQKWAEIGKTKALKGQTALYLLPGGYSAAAQTYIDQIFQQIGLVNLASVDPDNQQVKQGWRAFAFEGLISYRPDYLIVSFVDDKRPMLANHITTHPLFHDLGIKKVDFAARHWLCATWQMPEAAQSLQQALESSQ